MFASNNLAAANKRKFDSKMKSKACICEQNHGENIVFGSGVTSRGISHKDGRDLGYAEALPRCSLSSFGEVREKSQPHENTGRFKLPLLIWLTKVSCVP